MRHCADAASLHHHTTTTLTSHPLPLPPTVATEMDVDPSAATPPPPPTTEDHVSAGTKGIVKTLLEAKCEEELVSLTAEAKGMVAAGDLTGAVAKLLKHEKKCRLGSAWDATKATCLALLELCLEAGEWEALSANILLLSKRRSQHQKVQTGIIKGMVHAVEKTPDVATKLQLISTLRDVAEGKIFAEVERARE